MFRVVFFLSLSLIVLVSCGQTGPLYLPDEPTLSPTHAPPLSTSQLIIQSTTPLSLREITYEV